MYQQMCRRKPDSIIRHRDYFKYEGMAGIRLISIIMSRYSKSLRIERGKNEKPDHQFIFLLRRGVGHETKE